MKKQKIFHTLVLFCSLCNSLQAQNSNTVAGADAYQNGTASAVDNCAYGYGAMHANNTGSYNIGIGAFALAANTSGSMNVAVGSWAMNNNVTGQYNTAIGEESMLYIHTNTMRNSALGYQSLYRNQANDNNAFGHRAMRLNFTGFNNAAFGTSSLELNQVGSFNAAFGNNALLKNLANGNSAFGYAAAINNQNGTYNSAFGFSSLNSGLNGSFNTAIGLQSLFFAAKSNNSGLGAYAGKNATDAEVCTFLGASSDVIDSKLVYSNSTAIGNNARITASNQVVVGNTAVMSIGGFTSWTNFSDGRFKTDVVENVPGLEFISKLRPVSYHLDAHSIAKYLNEDRLDSLQAKQFPEMLALADVARNAKAIPFETGFIAQEVEEAAKSIGYDFSGVDAPQNETDLYGLRYAAFTVPLVKAVQELDQENQALKTQIQAIEAQNTTLKVLTAEILKRLEVLEALSAERNAQQSETLHHFGALKQNEPNPFQQTTRVQLTVPENATRATLRICNETGNVVQEMAIAEKGAVTLSLSAGTLSPGLYSYTLLVDGKVVDTKKMILSK